MYNYNTQTSRPVRYAKLQRTFRKTVIRILAVVSTGTEYDQVVRSSEGNIHHENKVFDRQQVNIRVTSNWFT